MQVKISSEDAGSIALTPVVMRDMPLRELVELMLGLTGKDPKRIAELLRRGTLVSSASRFRWAGLDMDVTDLLATFPDPNPTRHFDATHCVRLMLRSGPTKIDMARETAEKKRLLKSECFWDLLLATAPAPQYVNYSYKERADVYRSRLEIGAAKRISEGARLLAYSVLAGQVQALVPDAVDFYLSRE